MDKPFYVHNDDAGNPDFATAKEAVAWAEANDGTVWIHESLWTVDRRVELDRAERA